MKERGKGLESEYVALHAINYGFSFTEKEKYDVVLLFIKFLGLLVHFLFESSKSKQPFVADKFTNLKSCFFSLFQIAVNQMFDVFFFCCCF